MTRTILPIFLPAVFLLFSCVEPLDTTDDGLRSPTPTASEGFAVDGNHVTATLAQIRGEALLQTAHSQGSVAQNRSALLVPVAEVNLPVAVQSPEPSVDDDPVYDEAPPETDDGTRPETDDGTRPETDDGTRPETDDGTRPETDDGTRPETDDGTRDEMASGDEDAEPHSDLSPQDWRGEISALPAGGPQRADSPMLSFTYGGYDMVISGGYMVGDIGSVVGIDGRAQARRSQDWLDEYVMEFELMVETAGGAAMMVFLVWPSALDTFVRGQDLATTLLVGCAGEEVDDWTYDDQADIVHLSASADPNDPNRVHFEFTAWMDGAGTLPEWGWPIPTEVSGSFDLTWSAR